MQPWLSQLSSVQRKESKFHSSRWLQLATIGIDNTPRVRTVVFRGWSESREMEIYIDKRSQKYQELGLNNNVEICWLFLRSKCQFRFRGKSKIDIDNDYLSHWQQLSEKSKSLWNWPCPGDDFDFEKKEDFTFNKVAHPSNNFAILRIEITHVDQLLLHNPVHIRRRWIRENAWVEERINP
tara:strand:+ start:1289 stop:1831 length:543 start_codon:yes stop_codon:yes gene_type:complete